MASGAIVRIVGLDPWLSCDGWPRARSRMAQRSKPSANTLGQRKTGWSRKPAGCEYPKRNPDRTLDFSPQTPEFAPPTEGPLDQLHILPEVEALEQSTQLSPFQRFLIPRFSSNVDELCDFRYRSRPFASID